MRKTVCWALVDARGRLVQHDAFAHFESFRVATFRTKREAEKWAANDLFWRGRVTAQKMTITIKEYGSCTI